MGRRWLLGTLVTVSGAAALAWEVLWQIQTALALGASAHGAALTLAATMGGMSLGAYVMGRYAREWPGARALRAYGISQVCIGCLGWLLVPTFRALEIFDDRFFSQSPGSVIAVVWIGSLLTVALPATAMGATLPLIGNGARALGAPLSRLYGLNTLGAAGGAVAASFLLIPSLGVTGASHAIAAANLAIGALALFMLGTGAAEADLPNAALESASPRPVLPLSAAVAIAAATGWATFTLEIAWFRAMISAFKATSDAFAVLLATVLLALGAAAALVPRFRRARWTVDRFLAAAGVAVLLCTPVVERFDLLTGGRDEQPLRLIARWFGLAAFSIGPPVFLLGVALPWLLDERKNAREWGLVYGVNTLAAVAGALGGGWLLLPQLGVARTAWLAAGGVLGVALWRAPAAQRARIVLAGALALLIAVTLESRLGVDRAQLGIREGPFRPTRVLASFDAPDATYAAVETAGGHRLLIINGFMTSVQFGTATDAHDPTHYMRWMGHLPMLLHPNPQRALVICFGIGLTANAVRREQPAALDVVDLSRKVFDMAHLFPANEDVLSDPRVRAFVMDGRAFVRRKTNTYEVITLEPMPPNFAGTNALYSREFYEACRRRLTPDGICAQWLPLHLAPVASSRAIARTFQAVFPNVMLWIDPLSGTGILVGTADLSRPIGETLPGYARVGIERSLTEAGVRAAFQLNSTQLAQFAASGRIISDDNQLLSFGRGVLDSHRHLRRIRRENMDALEAVAGRREFDGAPVLGRPQTSSPLPSSNPRSLP